MCPASRTLLILGISSIIGAIAAVLTLLATRSLLQALLAGGSATSVTLQLFAQITRDIDRHDQ